MTVTPLPSPMFHATNPANGQPLAGGKIYTYLANTTSTPKKTWADADMNAENTNPVVLNAAGDAPIFGAGVYKIVVKTAGDVLVWEMDDVPVSSSASASQVGFDPYGDITADNVQDAIEQLDDIVGAQHVIYASVAVAAAATIPASIKTIRTEFFAPSYATLATLVGGARYSRISKTNLDAGSYPALATFRSTDRYTPSGTTDAVEGGYWLYNNGGRLPQPEQFGALGDNSTDDLAAFTAGAFFGGLKLGSKTYYLTNNVNCDVVLGEGLDRTIVRFAAIVGTSPANKYQGFTFDGASGIIWNLTIIGAKATETLSSYSDGAGKGAVRNITTRSFSAQNVRVRDWLGSGFLTAGGGGTSIATFIGCDGSNCGRPTSSPGTEYGDGFYTADVKKAVFLNCHYVGDLGTASARTTRCGFTVTSHPDLVQINGCSAINAHRSIHLEDVPTRTVIHDFYGEYARNGLQLFKTDDVHRMVSISKAHFYNCSDASDGVLNTGDCGLLELFAEDIYFEASGTSGNWYRHHQNSAPKRVHLKNCRDDGTACAGLDVAADELETLVLEDCTFLGGTMGTRRITNLFVRGGVFKSFSRNSSSITPRRQWRVRDCVIGRGISDAIPIDSDVFGDCVFEDITIEHNSSDGSHPLTELTQARAVFRNPRIVSAGGVALTTAWTGSSSTQRIEFDDVMNNTVQNYLTSSGATVRFGLRSYGDLTALLPSGTNPYEYARLRLGNGYYEWVDAAAGKHRIKSSAPTSDTDGTVLGTQT